MNRLIKALLIPFVRIFQGVLAISLIVLAAGIVYGVVYYDAILWQWNWKAAIVIHILTIYVLAVSYCYEAWSEWWPD